MLACELAIGAGLVLAAKPSFAGPPDDLGRHRRAGRRLGRRPVARRHAGARMGRVTQTTAGTSLSDGGDAVGGVGESLGAAPGLLTARPVLFQSRKVPR